ncbi:hypothetical protein HMPREF1318_0896 [Actinomyces massiliensis F0489]|uniref:Uncharacterized protein n=1 Tax=Actinomyces massiliensis F0489 TaxID=1125718 RepID=J1GVG2_9ACTO|nr:hypothetical protein HMPREF1318_0896 [Actinomyces massiliensis F0489]
MRTCWRGTASQESAAEEADASRRRVGPSVVCGAGLQRAAIRPHTRGRGREGNDPVRPPGTAGPPAPVAKGSGAQRRGWRGGIRAADAADTEEKDSTAIVRPIVRHSTVVSRTCAAEPARLRMG